MTSLSGKKFPVNVHAYGVNPHSMVYTPNVRTVHAIMESSIRQGHNPLRSHVNVSTNIPSVVYYENNRRPEYRAQEYRAQEDIDEISKELDLLDMDRNIAWVDKLLADSPESPRKFRNSLNKGKRSHYYRRRSSKSKSKSETATKQQESEHGDGETPSTPSPPPFIPPLPSTPRPSSFNSPCARPPEQYTTPPHYRISSPPKLTRNLPGSNLWIRRNGDGAMVNQFGTVLPFPIRLYSLEDTHNYNVIALEQGISRGYVSVRNEYVDLNALEEGRAHGWVNGR